MDSKGVQEEIFNTLFLVDGDNYVYEGLEAERKYVGNIFVRNGLMIVLGLIIRPCYFYFSF